MDDIKKSLNYQPNISYEDEYYSEKSYEESTTSIIVQEDNKTEEDIKDLIDKIDISLFGLPQYMQIVINNVFNPIKDFFEENKDDIYPGKPGTTPGDPGDGSGDKPDIEDPDDKDPDDPEDIGPDDEIPDIGDDHPPNDDEDDMFEPLVHIVDNELSILEQINRGYSEHFYDLLKDYLEKLYEALSNHWVVVVPFLFGKSKELKKFMTSDIPSDFKIDKDKQHILDLSVRCELMKKEKISFAAKNFSLDETIVKLRNFKASHELMLRYAKTDYKNINTKEDSDYNAMLEACMLNYNRKYNNSVLNLYKYLDSSVRSVDNALTTYAEEIKCKQYLK